MVNMGYIWTSKHRDITLNQNLIRKMGNVTKPLKKTIRRAEFKGNKEKI